MSGIEPQGVDVLLAVPDDAVRLAEALIFAGTEPVSLRRLAELLELRQLVPDGVEDLGAFVAAVMGALVARYEGRGVMPVEVAGGWQFRTAPDLAPALTRVLEKPRRLPRAVMETLAIIAYHQPCTRVEIEEIRGVSLGQNVLDTLIEASLIAPRGRKEVPGRPVLWGTTPDFLRHFGLRALSDLPRREELLVDVPDTLTSARKPAQDATEHTTSEPEASEEHLVDADEVVPSDDGIEVDPVETDPDLTPAEGEVAPVQPELEPDAAAQPDDVSAQPEADAGAATVSEPGRS
ncbi:SMC-Scp complex subunit ScpB [Acetobacter sp. P5B1]|uniref:SMC-Scp complex subunit ScpB n=1 Tax=Acetobacter sp. P5B1 TaxID=2762620 RepID=UPI00207B3C56|nr:SMC-Scp complex subunit ScpB [Acetobacter sp. P5B1]